jgi:hypothetical protein
MAKKSTQSVTPVQVATPAPVAAAPVAAAPVAAPAKLKKQKGGAAPAPVVATPTPAPVVATPVKKAKKGGATSEPAVAAPAPVVATPSPVVVAPEVKQEAGSAKPKRATKAKKTPSKGKTTEAKPKKAAATRKEAKPKAVAATSPATEGEERGRYFKYQYNGTVSGRFSGSKPKQAANKALTSIVKSRLEEGEDLTNQLLTFSIIECTRGSKKKEYRYQGVRRALDKPIEVKIKNKDKPITYKFQNRTNKLKPTVASASA